MLLQTQTLTPTIESLNRQILDYLAPLNRKTKRYSKPPSMAEITIYSDSQLASYIPATLERKGGKWG